MSLDSTIQNREARLADPTPVLVQEVLRQLRVKDRKAPARSVAQTSPRFESVLRDAVLAPDFDMFGALRHLTDAGITFNDIADAYVPAVARRLGCDWVDDSLSFARVTVAAGRLQSVLGRLSQSNDTLRAVQHGAPNVLLVSFEGDQHTLGWKLVSVQLRRRGAATHAVLDIAPDAVADIAEHADFDLVLISASRPQVLDQVARMVAVLRSRMVPVPPIVLGGIIVDMPGADICRGHFAEITNCLDTALSCRLRKMAHRRAALA